jgi:hypothetical protein
VVVVVVVAAVAHEARNHGAKQDTQETLQRNTTTRLAERGTCIHPLSWAIICQPRGCGNLITYTTDRYDRVVVAVVVAIAQRKESKSTKLPKPQAAIVAGMICSAAWHTAAGGDPRRRSSAGMIRFEATGIRRRYDPL